MIDQLALLLITGLISYRITRFLLFDSLIGMSDPDNENNQENPTSPMAIRLDNFAYTDTGEDRSFIRGKIGDLLTCPWCTGFWVSVGVYALFTWSLPWTVDSPGAWVLMTFGVAGLQGFVQSRMNA
jgi:hypothetical protein